MHRIGERKTTEVSEVTTKPTSVRDTLYCARMARDLLWENPRKINLDDFVPVTQT